VLVRHLAADLRTKSVLRFGRQDVVAVAGGLATVQVRILTLNSGDESEVADLDGAVVRKEDVARFQVPAKRTLG